METKRDGATQISSTCSAHQGASIDVHTDFQAPLDLKVRDLRPNFDLNLWG